VHDLNLAQAADELYGLAPAAFTAARDQRAKQTRAAGDGGLAAAIRKLRRPTVSAWLVNLLAREHTGRLEALAELGEALREAQRSLDGDRLRAASAQRRQLVGELLQEAKRLAAQADQAAGAQVQREITGTLEAAIADPEVAAAVRRGWLTGALSYAGLGGPDLSSVAAAPLAATRHAPARRSGPARTAGAGETGGPRQQPPSGPRRGSRPRDAAGASRSRGAGGHGAGERRARDAAAAGRAVREAAERAEREAAERAVGEAAARAASARQELEAAQRRFAGAEERQQAAQRHRDELERQLAGAQAEHDRLVRAARDARREHSAAQRSLAAAEEHLARARERAARQR
jgi:hypothetical protein